jgi:tetratricopeptide (TPR) repeat protein
MADIFLSYSREDRAAIEPLAEQIIAAGYSLWWDRQLTGGKRYLEETEAELNAAKVVLVVWSKTSIASHWVADEAGAGRDTGRLLPISLDGSMPPLGFRQFQVIDFAKWTRDDDAAFRQLTGALAKLTAPSGEAIAAPAPKKKTAGGPFGLPGNPLVLGLAALAAVAILVVVALNLMAPTQAGASNGKLTAFFGFTPSGNDPAVRSMAEAATAETFKTFSALGLETASEASTRDVKLADQLDAAKSLKARYALGGEVRQTASRYDIAIRIDDVDTGKTLWREAMTGGAEQTTSLPVAAAAQATTTINCLVRVLEETGRPTEAVLAILPRACASFQLGTNERIPVWRQAVKLLPNSAHAHHQLATAVYAFSALNPGPQRAALEAEAREAAKRAVSLDPGSAAQDILLRLTMAQAPLAEIEMRYAEAVSENGAEQLEYGYGLLLMMVGRIEDAVPHLRRAAQANPLSYNTLAYFGHALMQNGQTLEARSVFEQINARLPSSFGWVFWITNEIADPDGDADLALKLAPPMTSGDTIACYRDFAAAAKLPNGAARTAAADRVRTCTAQTGFGFVRVIGALAFLGDVDGAFARTEQMLGSGDGIALAPMVSELLSREAPAMRADPRFLPLVKRVGIYQYWLDTNTQPDACKRPEERKFEVCRELRKDQGK